MVYFQFGLIGETMSVPYAFPQPTKRCTGPCNPEVDFIINGGCIGHGTPKISELLNSHKGLITNTDAGGDVWVVWSWL